MQTQLMFLPGQEVLIPVSPSAFTAAVGPRRRLSRYVGALVVSPSGEARTIKSIRVEGIWGSSTLRRFVSLLTSAWSISVEFDASAPLPIGELKERVVRCIQADAGDSEPYLPRQRPLEEVISGVRGAHSVEGIFQEIAVPRPEDALDVL